MIAEEIQIIAEREASALTETDFNHAMGRLGDLASKNGPTALGELLYFVAECPPEVAAGWTGRLRKLAAESQPDTSDRAILLAAAAIAEAWKE
jgi:predicted secreted protein